MLGLLSLAGAAAGVALANALSGRVLRDAFAALMVLVAVQLVRRAPSDETGEAPAAPAARAPADSARNVLALSPRMT